MPRISLLLIMIVSTAGLVRAQLPYTNPVYPIWKDSAVLIGTAPNYCGRNYDLKMNIYKPVGDGNTQRPVIVFAHGGAFTSGEDFNEYNMNQLAMEFAKRGYVAASINYREGHHLFPYGTGLPAPIGLGIFADWTANARLFISDSAEATRALYRAQQDTKAALRKIKERHSLDSSSTCKVFLGGHSAGAITAMAAAFMDISTEKSPFCNAISTVANPNWISDGFDWFGSWVITQVNGPQDRDDNAYRAHNPSPFNYDAASCYTRPDLGPVDGSVNIGNGYDTKIIGVASLAGAVADTNVFTGPRTPAVFMYHIANDQVVPYNYGRPFNYLNDLLTPAPNGRWPIFYGSYWMEQKLKAINYPAAHQVQVFDNGANPLNSHDILPNHAVVADSIAQFFARVMDTTTACSNIVLALGDRFTASKQGGTALLEWESQSSSAVARFIIERSVDGISFTSLGSMADPTRKSFRFIDSRPEEGSNFYRILSLMSNGQVELSAIRLLKFSRPSNIDLFPNPAKDHVFIRLERNSATSPVYIYIYDMQGRMLINRSTISSGIMEVPVNMLVSGQYEIRIMHGSAVYNSIITVIK